MKRPRASDVDTRAMMICARAQREDAGDEIVPISAAMLSCHADVYAACLRLPTPAHYYAIICRPLLSID